MESPPSPGLERLLYPERLPISTDIAPNDGMFAGNMSHYLGVAHSALRSIGASMLLAGVGEPARVLDLPCGHGRVMRALRAAFPHSEITGCDLDRDGVAHCTRAFGAVGVVSVEDPDAIRLPGSYDLVWCGSLFTHLAAARWDGFLSLFERVLAPNGVLVFTTHGRWPEQWLRQGRTRDGLTIEQMYGLPPAATATLLASYEKTGFGYVDYPGQHGYGISLSSLPFVVAFTQRITGLRLLVTAEHAWDAHQDVVSCQKLG